jgi:Fe2+ or Zn2+ uptake regulation protein
MSDTDSPTHDRTAIRKTIREVIQQADNESLQRSYLLSEVEQQTAAGVDAAAARRELDALEREGFVYLVGDREFDDGDDPEVKMV